MAVAAAEEAIRNPPPPEPTLIEKAPKSADSALKLHLSALEYSQTVDKGIPFKKWKETADKKLTRAHKYYMVKRQNLIDLYGDAGLPADVADLYPSLD